MIKTYYLVPIDVSLLQPKKHKNGIHIRGVRQWREDTHTLGLRIQLNEEDRGHLWIRLNGEWHAGELLCDTFNDINPIGNQNLINFYKAIL